MLRLLYGERFPFPIKDRWYEAVGYEENPEEILPVLEALKRVWKKTGREPINDEKGRDDYSFLSQNITLLPKRLRGNILYTGHLITEWPVIYHFAYLKFLNVPGHESWLYHTTMTPADDTEANGLVLLRLPQQPDTTSS